MTMMLMFYNARKHGDDESYVMWGLTEDDGLLPEFEDYRKDVRADCYRAEDHSEDGEGDCEHCQVYINDEFGIADGQVLAAPSGKKYRITITEA